MLPLTLNVDQRLLAAVEKLDCTGQPTIALIVELP